MEQRTQNFENLGYKIVITDERRYKIVGVAGYLTIIGLALAVCIFQIASVSAIELNLNKNESCALFNYTGTQCDSFWCVSGLKGNWTADEICILNTTSVINITNETNFTYMNETMIREWARNETLGILENESFINASTMILIKNNILDSQDNRTEEIVRSYAGDFGSSNTREPIPSSVIIACVVVFGLVIITITYFNSKKKKEEDFSEEDFEHLKTRHHKPYKPSKEDIKEYEKTGKLPEAEKEEDEE